MKKSDKEALRDVIERMHRQDNWEKFETLLTVLSQLSLKVDFDDLQFPVSDPYGVSPLPLNHIYCVLVDEEHLYILCYNRKLHIDCSMNAPNNTYLCRNN